MSAFTRSLYALLNLFYCLCMIAFYATCFVSLVNVRISLEDDAKENDRNDTYYVLLLCNAMKPFVWLVVLYYDTRLFFGTIDSLISGALALFVLFSTIGLEVNLVIEKILYCNQPGVHFNNPCNDILYCCKYKDNPTCKPHFPNPESSCIFRNLPQEAKDSLTSNNPSVIWSNDTRLTEENVILNTDRLFIICLVINSIILVVEFLLLFSFVQRVNRKVSKESGGTTTRIDDTLDDGDDERLDIRRTRDKLTFRDPKEEGFYPSADNNDDDEEDGNINYGGKTALKRENDFKYDGSKFTTRFANLKWIKFKNALHRYRLSFVALCVFIVSQCKEFFVAVFTATKSKKKKSKSSDKNRDEDDTNIRRKNKRKERKIKKEKELTEMPRKTTENSNNKNTNASSTQKRNVGMFGYVMR